MKIVTSTVVVELTLAEATLIRNAVGKLPIDDLAQQVYRQLTDLVGELE